MPNRTIDALLHNAISDHDTDKVKELIAKGANPFATMIDPKTSANDPLMIVKRALKSQGIKLFTIIIEHALKVRTATYEPLNLRAKVLDVARTEMNLLQFATLNSNPSIRRALYEYAKTTGQAKNIKQVLDAEITVTDEDGYKSGQFLSTMLVRTISRTQMLLNFHSAHKSADKQLKDDSFIDEWIQCIDASEIQPYDGDAIEIEYLGAWESLRSSLEFDIDLKDHLYKGYSAQSLVRKLIEWSKDASNWNGLQSLLRFRDVTPVSEAFNTGDGRVYFYAMIKNPHGICETKFKIILDYSRMNNLLNPKPAAVNHAALKALSAKVDGLESLINETAERLYERTQASLTERPDALHCFNVLQRTIRAELTAPEMAATGRFAIKPTTKAAFVANTAQAILNVSVQSMPVPFAALITGVTAVLVQEITQAHARKQIGGVLNATEGMNISKLATQVAALMTAKAMECYENAITERNINAMVSSLKAEFGKLYQFRNQAELAVHLFDQATMSLPEPKRLNDAYNSSTSADSSPNGKQQAWQMTAYVAHSDSDDRLKKTTKPNKSMLSWMPGYSCMHPTM